MSHNTWAHRLVRIGVRPLAGTGVTPNHLTTMRLVTGVAAAAAFAVGSPGWTALAGAIHIVSMLLDRADGVLARMTGQGTPWGHRYDLFCDNTVTTLLFIGIGVGLRDGAFGSWAVPLGVVAGFSIPVIFWIVPRIEALLPSGEQAIPNAAGFDADDTLFIVAPIAWLGWLEPFLVAAAVGAPLFAVGTAIYLRRLRRSAIAAEQG